MKKIGLIVTGIVLLLICSTCRKEHVAPVNQLLKDLFCFKEGSEWTYYDSVSQTTQKMRVTSCEDFQGAPAKARGKIYDWDEVIRMDIAIENISYFFSKTGETELAPLSGHIYSPVTTELYLRCDENNNFTSQGVVVTYLSTYTANEITYSDVYLFNSKDNAAYYVSKHIGFIRCMKDNKYDLVLIDKNIQQ